MLRRLILICLCAATVFTGGGAWAHDPSAYGGLFRSRDFGKTWLNADVGLFLGAALSLAIDPAAPDHLLMGTDTGLLASTNGGRKWTPEAPDRLYGAVFAVVFLAGGTSALCATPASVFKLAGGQWQKSSAPAGAVPARAIVAGSGAGRIHMVGRDSLFHSEDAGVSWVRTEHDLPEPAVFTELVRDTAASDALLAVVDGRVMVSTDDGNRWSPLSVGLPASAAEGLSPDPVVPGRRWVGSADRIFRADAVSSTWQAVGRELPESGTNIRGIAANPEGSVIVVATHRGLYRTENAGNSWTFLEDNLPVHLDSRPLMHDPSRLGTIYAGFSLMPHAEVWRLAVEGGNLLERIDPVSLAGGIAFLLVIGVAGIVTTRWLLRRAARGQTTASEHGP